METTFEEFQIHYRYISNVIDFLTAFQDSRRVIEKTSQSDIDNLLRSLRMLRNTSDHFESFTNTVYDHPEQPEHPEFPEHPELGPEDPLGEPWYPINEEETERNN